MLLCFEELSLGNTSAEIFFGFRCPVCSVSRAFAAHRSFCVVNYDELFLTFAFDLLVLRIKP